MAVRSFGRSVSGGAARLAILLILLFGCTGKSGAEGPQVTPGKGLRVLFLGNSLTYSNDIPLIVQALAKAAGETLHERSVTFPNFNLEDQWTHGEALQALASQKWDFVVMQQGPSSLPENREDMRKWAKQFAPKIRQAGARPALYMVWPDRSRLAYFDDVREAYSLTASDVGGMFIPAGEAWRAAWRRDPNAPLYSFDDFHPSVAGSYAAALSIYGMLYRRAPKGLPAKLAIAGGHSVEVPEPLAKLLQDAATEANQKYGRP
jgi:hypothetical protein